MGSGPHIVWMSAAPWIHLLPYLFLPPVVMAHLDCTYNSWTLLSCSWDADGNFTSSPCYISANVIDEKRDIKGFCFLTSSDNPRRCTIDLTSDEKPVKEILTDHKLNLSVICSNGMKKNTSITFLSDFFAFHNLLLDPPVSTDIKMISYGLWQLTWDLNHRRNIGNTECEIQYKPVNQLWQDAQNVKVKNVKLVILHSLHPDTQYEAKVRVNQTNFPGGRWSDWGKPVRWTTHPEGRLDCTHNSLDTVSCSWEVARNFSSTSCYLLAYVVNDSRCLLGGWVIFLEFESPPPDRCATCGGGCGDPLNPPDLQAAMLRLRTSCPKRINWCPLCERVCTYSCEVNKGRFYWKVFWFRNRFCVTLDFRKDLPTGPRAPGMNHVDEFSDAMTVAQFMNVSVICRVGKNINKTITSLSHFYPFINLRLDPPTSLDIRMIEDGTWNLSWVNTYRNYIDNVETEVHFKPVKWSWKDAKRFTITQCDLSVLLRDLYPDSLYEAKVRINQTNFPGGRWSDWSKPVQWTTPPKNILGSTFPTPGVVAIPVVLLIVVVALCSSKRVKKVMWIGVPDPAHFFHPLIDTHKGNFKKWLSTPYVFSSYFLDPSPLDISPLNINCKVEEQSLKGSSTAESEKDKLADSSSSYTNQEYFSSVCLGYDHFPTTAVNDSLHSPTDEEIPLFQAEYLCAPQSIAGFGVHNGSFERDASPQVIQNPVLAEEAIAKPQCDDEGGEKFTHQETENVKEHKGKEIFEDHKESSDIFSSPMAYQHDGKPSMEASVSVDYLSLKELCQKHCQWV